MKRLNRNIINSTSETTIAAISHITEENNKILTAKALRRLKLNDFLISATEREKNYSYGLLI